MNIRLTSDDYLALVGTVIVPLALFVSSGDWWALVATLLCGYIWASTAGTVDYWLDIETFPGNPLVPYDYE